MSKDLSEYTLQKAIDNLRKLNKEVFDCICLWDSIPEEDKNKPMGISCPCKKCSPWSL